VFPSHTSGTPVFVTPEALFEEYVFKKVENSESRANEGWTEITTSLER